MDARPADRAIPLSHAEIRTIVIGVMLAMFLAALDQTIVATALPTIGRELHNVADLPWVVTAYLVAATAATPLYGKFSDIHGRRITMLVAISTFIVGSLVCALAPSMFVLIAGRALQGLGGGGLISLAQTAVADVAAPRERGRYQAYFASVFAASSLAGPVLGGVIAEHLHWSVIFWINLPLGVLAYVMTSRALKRLPRHERWHRLDVLGAVLITAASVCLMLALSWGGARVPWSSPEIIGLFGGSLVLWALFAARLLTAEEPLIPLAILRNGVVRTGTAASCFGMGALIGLTVFLPLFFETVMGLTAGQSGLALIPLTVGVVCGATFAGRRLAHITHYKRVPLAGTLIAAGGCLILAHFAARMSLPFVDATLAADQRRHGNDAAGHDGRGSKRCRAARDGHGDGGDRILSPDRRRTDGRRVRRDRPQRTFLARRGARFGSAGRREAAISSRGSAGCSWSPPRRTVSPSSCS